MTHGTVPNSLQEEIRKSGPFESPEQEAFLSIRRTCSILDTDFERFFKSHGLSTATFNVLRILRGAGERGRMCHEIREHMVAQVPDITRLVDRLESAGLAARCRCDKDRRVVHCKITEQGIEMLRKLDALVIERHKRQLGHMTHDELLLLSKLLLIARHPPVPLDEDQSEGA